MSVPGNLQNSHNNYPKFIKVNVFVRRGEFWEYVAMPPQNNYVY